LEGRRKVGKEHTNKVNNVGDKRKSTVDGRENVTNASQQLKKVVKALKGKYSGRQH
jgi:hypothetical protein